MKGNDLNRLLKAYWGLTFDGRNRVFRSNHLFTINGSYSLQTIYENCRQVQRRLQVSALYVQKPILLHGFRPTHLQEQPYGHCCLFKGQSEQAAPDEIRGRVPNTLSNANMNWRIYAELAQVLINRARKLYADEKFSEEINELV